MISGGVAGQGRLSKNGAIIEQEEPLTTLFLPAKADEPLALSCHIM
jgi:hypothetical protein